MASTARLTKRTRADKDDETDTAPAKRHTLTTETRKKTAKKVAKKEDDSSTPRKRAVVKASPKSTVKAPMKRKAVVKDDTKSKTKTKKSTSPRTGRLEADLKKYNNEEFTQAELIAGVQLVVQVAGLEVMAPTLLALLTEWIPGLDERMEKEAVQSLKAAVKKKYASCTVDQRKTLRAVIHWIGNDFKLHTIPETAAFTTDFTGISVVESQAEPLNLRPFSGQ